jgi:hypothetical protein
VAEADDVDEGETLVFEAGGYQFVQLVLVLLQGGHRTLGDEAGAGADGQVDEVEGRLEHAVGHRGAHFAQGRGGRVLRAGHAVGR